MIENRQSDVKEVAMTPNQYDEDFLVGPLPLEEEEPRGVSYAADELGRKAGRG